MTYYPDKWLLVKTVSPAGKILYKVFASFFGGYGSGNSWKLNSGITEIEEEGDTLRFYGVSGSVYSCHKQQYGAHSYGACVVDGWEKEYPDNIIVLNEPDAFKVIAEWSVAE